MISINLEDFSVSSIDDVAFFVLVTELAKVKT